MSTNYAATVTVPSKIPAFAGVSFVLNRVSYGLRSRLRRDLVPALQKIRDLNEKMQLEVTRYGLDGLGEEPEEVDASAGRVLAEDEAVPVAAEAGSIAGTPQPKKFSADQEKAVDRITDLGQQIDLVTAELSVPVYLRHGLVSVEGLSDGKGQPFTPDTIYQFGPEDLCEEIVQTFMAMVNPSREQQENLELPTTSGAAAGGPTIVTTAPNVNGNKPIADAIAESTFQIESTQNCPIGGPQLIPPARES